MWLSPLIIVISNCQPQRFDGGSENIGEALCQLKINPLAAGSSFFSSGPKQLFADKQPPALSCPRSSSSANVLRQPHAPGVAIQRPCLTLLSSPGVLSVLFPPPSSPHTVPLRWLWEVRLLMKESSRQSQSLCGWTINVALRGCAKWAPSAQPQKRPCCSVCLRLALPSPLPRAAPRASTSEVSRSPYVRFLFSEHLSVFLGLQAGIHRDDATRYFRPNSEKFCGIWECGYLYHSTWCCVKGGEKDENCSLL